MDKGVTYMHIMIFRHGLNIERHAARTVLLGVKP